MIEYVDVAMAEWLKERFPDHVVAWGDPSEFQRVLADAAIKKQKEENKAAPRNMIGLPGLVICRTDVNPRRGISDERMAVEGWSIARFSDDSELPKWFNRIQTRLVEAEYTIIGYAESLSDANFIHRDLSFLDMQTTINTKIPAVKTPEDEEDEVEPYNIFNWAIRKDGVPRVEREIAARDTAKITKYKITLKVYVDTLWARTRNIPPIDTIVVKYEDMMNGDPVELENITILLQDE